MSTLLHLPRRRFLGVTTLVLLALSLVGTAAAASPHTRDADQQRSLAQVRAATARYHDVSVAEAAGYVPVSPCVEAPGLGAMGVHYLNPALLDDGVIDPAAPELLLYLPNDHGRLRLIGVEYLQVDADQDLATDDDRPSLFGVPFDGPMDGHGPGEPVHYDLHVWIWSHNPAGTFAAWNPALSCGAALDVPAPHTGH